MILVSLYQKTLFRDDGSSGRPPSRKSTGRGLVSRLKNDIIVKSDYRGLPSPCTVYLDMDNGVSASTLLMTLRPILTNCFFLDDELILNVLQPCHGAWKRNSSGDFSK
jgi:hypothetical protein